MININISRKHLIFLVLVIAIATVINYTIAQGGTQSHPASEVEAGSFAEGTYTFPGTVSVGTQLVAAEVCIPDSGSCETAWPSGGGGAFLIYLKGISTNCAAKCSSLGKECAFATLDGGGYVLELADCSTSGTRQCACYP